MTAPDNNSMHMLEEVTAAGRRARAARPSKAVPLAGLALVVLGAMPFYFRWPSGAGWSNSSGVSRLSGYGLVEHPTAAALYWLVALPLAYLLIVAYLVRRGSTSGVRLRARRVVGWGLSLFAAIVVATVIVPQLELLPGDVLARGLTPLFAISGGIMLWGVLDRDYANFGIGSLAMAASAVANLYNLENPILAQGVGFDPRYSLLLNLALPGIVLAIGAITVAARDRTR